MSRFVLITITAIIFTAAAWAGLTFSTPSNLGTNINTPSAELDPSVGPGGLTMYFASNRGGGFGGYDLYISNNSGGVWQPGGNMGGTVNSGSNEMAPAYLNTSPPYLYFHSNRAGGQGNNDIWRTAYSSGAWQAPTVQTPLNSGSEDVQPYMVLGSPNRCYFSSNRAGGFGGYDIWVATSSGSTWSTPVNLGAGVNTVYDEIGPTIDLSNEFMFFYSNRGGGYGGYDLYSAAAIGASWGNVSNLGDVVNGPWFEGTPGRSTDTETLFFASDRSTGYGSYDLYQTFITNVGVAPASLGRVKTLFK